MIPRKKKILVILIITLIIISIVIAFILLYKNTDIFKSNQTLFLKYVGQNIENLNKNEEIFEKTELDDILQKNSYTENSEIKINYTKNIGTTLENTNNQINKLKLKIEGKTDKENQYDYKNIKLLQEENPLFNIETIRDNNVYGIRFSDLFKQYVLGENNSTENVFEKIGFTQEEISIISNIIENNNDILNEFKFTKEELESLNNKYTAILKNKFSNDNFEKITNQVITVNQKEIATNAYILKITKENLNNIYIEILKNLKEDEIFLQKIETIQQYISKYTNIFNDKDNLKDSIIEKIEKTIEDINKNNIGDEETQIIVYENNGTTVRTTIIGVDYNINYDFIKNEQEQYTQILLEKNKVETKKVTLKNTSREMEISINNNENENSNTITLKQNVDLKEKNPTRNIQIEYEDNTNRIQAAVTQNFNILEALEKEELNNTNCIILNQLDDEQMKTVLARLTEGLNSKIEELRNKIEMNDMQEILKTIGIIQEKQKIEEGTTVSEIEKNQFNSKFQILQGEDISSENMAYILDSIKENVLNLEVISNEKLKIRIDKSNSNEDIINTLKKFFEQEKDKKFNINIENDEETGLVKYLVLTINKE